MKEFLIWYFNLNLGQTLLFAFQAIVLMMLCGLPIVATRAIYKKHIKPRLKAWTARPDTATALPHDKREIGSQANFREVKSS